MLGPSAMVVVTALFCVHASVPSSARSVQGHARSGPSTSYKDAAARLDVIERSNLHSPNEDTAIYRAKRDLTRLRNQVADNAFSAHDIRARLDRVASLRLNKYTHPTIAAEAPEWITTSFVKDAFSDDSEVNNSLEYKTAKHDSGKFSKAKTMMERVVHACLTKHRSGASSDASLPESAKLFWKQDPLFGSPMKATSVSAAFQCGAEAMKACVTTSPKVLCAAAQRQMKFQSKRRGDVVAAK
jgi:hypothetical protein